MKLRQLFVLVGCLLAFFATQVSAERCMVPLFTDEQFSRLTEKELRSLQDIYSFFEADRDQHFALSPGVMSQPIGTTFLWYALTGHESSAYAINALVECPCVKFSRKRCSCLRQWAEEALVHEMEIRYPDKTMPITYLAIGSGGMFYDLVLLSKLVFAGYTDINIVLVDKIYTELIGLVNAGGRLGGDITVPTLIQFVRWLSFLQTTHRTHPRFSFVLGDSYEQDVAEQSADVLVLADLGLKPSHMLDAMVGQCFEKILKNRGVFVFLLDKFLGGGLAEMVGQPQLRQYLIVDVFAHSGDKISQTSVDLTVYVGAKGASTRSEPCVLPPERCRAFNNSTASEAR